jgi:hypothetical protein
MLLTVSFVCLAQPALTLSVTASQRPTGTVKTDSRILYHNGLVMTGPQDVYFIWYGCWDNTCGNNGDTTTQLIMTDFMSNVGASPYFQILTAYTNDAGQGPNGAAFFGGQVFDQYSRGLDSSRRYPGNHLRSDHQPSASAGSYRNLRSASFC